MSEEKTPSKKQKLEEIRTKLFSQNDADILSALKDVRKKGDSSFVSPLLEAYLDSENDQVKAELETLLSTLKVSGTEEPFVAALSSDRFKHVHGDVLKFMWNSNINLPQHLGLIVKTSVAGDFIQLLEGLTLVEHMDGPHIEVQVTDAILTMRQFMASNKDESKKELADTLFMLLLDIESQV